MNLGDSVSPKTFGEILGDPKKRYFSRGYRHVQHELRVDSIITLTPNKFDAKGIGRVSYPHDWSFSTEDTIRKIHLSSIDAIVLLTRTVETIVELFSLAPLTTARLTVIRLQSGSTPCADLSKVSVELSMRLENACTAEIHAVIGGFKLEATIVGSEHQSSKIADYRPYQQGYLDTRLDSIVEAWDPVTRTITTRHEIHAPRVEGTRLTGLDSGSWPTITQVGNLLLFGQLAQILVLFGTGISRGSSENLWIRRLRLNSAIEEQQHFTAQARLVKYHVIDRDGHKFHSLMLQAKSSQGLFAKALFGFIEQGKGPESPA